MTMAGKPNIQFDVRDYLYDNVSWDGVQDAERAEIVKDAQETWQAYMIASDGTLLDNLIFVIGGLFAHYSHLLESSIAKDSLQKANITVKEMAGALAYLLWLRSSLHKYNEATDGNDNSLYFDVYDIDVTLDSVSWLIGSMLNTVSLPQANYYFNQVMDNLTDTRNNYEFFLFSDLQKIPRVE